jgi:hypothetical protein
MVETGPPPLLLGLVFGKLLEPTPDVLLREAVGGPPRRPLN